VETLLPALIAGVTALAVALLTSFLTIRRDAKLRRGEEQRSVNMQYLNPTKNRSRRELFSTAGN
jgi:hypothetical protein